MTAAAQRRGWDQEAEFAEWRERKRKAPRFTAAHQGGNLGKGPSPARRKSPRTTRRTRRASARPNPSTSISYSHPPASKPKSCAKPSQTAAPLPSCWPGQASKRTATRTTTAHCNLRKVVRARYPQLVDAALCRRSRRMGRACGGARPILPCSGCATRKAATSNPSPKRRRERGPSWKQGVRTSSWTHSSNAYAPSAQAKSPYSPSTYKEVPSW